MGDSHSAIFDREEEERLERQAKENEARARAVPLPAKEEEEEKPMLDFIEAFEHAAETRSAREHELETENERLKQKLRRYERKPEFKNARFFHVPFCGTVAFITTSGGWGPRTRVGLALVALDRYFDGSKQAIPPSLLLDEIDNIEDVKPGDAFNRPLGRLISYGRAKKQRNYCSVMSPGEIEEVISTIRAEMEDLESFAFACGVYYEKGTEAPTVDEFSPEYLEFVAACGNIQKMMKALFAGEEG